MEGGVGGGGRCVRVGVVMGRWVGVLRISTW